MAANPGEVTAAFGDISYMQEMTTDVCKAAKVGDTGQLTDSRDNKVYWVAKLADLNCWMTQNLDYDDSSSTKVSAPSGWTDTSANYRAYYDPGPYVLTTPTSWTSCTASNGLAGCTSKGWANVNGWTASNVANNATIADSTKQIYDAHYHAGNYYSWQAATAGTGSSATTNGATASSSICPGQWKLPIGNNSNNGSFGYLLSQYSVQSTPTGNGNTIYGNPLYFVAGGGVWSGKLYNAGSYGYYWSSTALSSDSAYLLYFASGGVTPSNSYPRYFGQSVRCLVQGS